MEREFDYDYDYLYIGLLKETELGTVEVLNDGLNGYHRIETMFNGAEWEFVDEDEEIITNLVDISFPQVKRTWGHIIGFAIFASMDSEEPIAIGDIINGRTMRICKGMQVKFSEHGINIELKALEI